VSPQSQFDVDLFGLRCVAHIVLFLECTNLFFDVFCDYLGDASLLVCLALSNFLFAFAQEVCALRVSGGLFDLEAQLADEVFDVADLLPERVLLVDLCRILRLEVHVLARDVP